MTDPLIIDAGTHLVRVVRAGHNRRERRRVICSCQWQETFPTLHEAVSAAMAHAIAAPLLGVTG